MKMRVKADMSVFRPATGGDWLAWLADPARVTHRVMARSGRLFWVLTARHLPPRLMAADTANRQAFHGLFGATAATLWRAAGGNGGAPEPLRQAVAAHLSPLFTQSVLLNADGTLELPADMATTAITATVRQRLSWHQGLWVSHRSAGRRRDCRLPGWVPVNAGPGGGQQPRA
jgi:hypothetical protein